MSTVTALPNGPYKLDSARLVDAEGSLVQDGALYLCRCGHSANKPFCDGAHVAAGFEA